jgi:hypothetical protein
VIKGLAQTAVVGGGDKRECNASSVNSFSQTMEVTLTHWTTNATTPFSKELTSNSQHFDKVGVNSFSLIED